MMKCMDGVWGPPTGSRVKVGTLVNGIGWVCSPLKPDHPALDLSTCRPGDPLAEMNMHTPESSLGH